MATFYTPRSKDQLGEWDTMATTNFDDQLSSASFYMESNSHFYNDSSSSEFFRSSTDTSIANPPMLSLDEFLNQSSGSSAVIGNDPFVLPQTTGLIHPPQNYQPQSNMKFTTASLVDSSTLDSHPDLNSSDDNISLSSGVASAATAHCADPEQELSSKDKKERNRESAKKYRQKKKRYLGGLEDEIGGLQGELNKKDSVISALEAENRMLKEQLTFLQKLFASAAGNPLSTTSAFALAIFALFIIVIPFTPLGSGMTNGLFSMNNLALSNNNEFTMNHGRKLTGHDDLDSYIPSTPAVSTYDCNDSIANSICNSTMSYFSSPYFTAHSSDEVMDFCFVPADSSSYAI